jgi:hypothetical protein
MRHFSRKFLVLVTRENVRGPYQVSKVDQWQLQEDLSGGDYLNPQPGCPPSIVHPLT